MSKLELTDSILDITVKMSDGNPGAIMALMELMNEHIRIEPQALFSGISAIMLLDTWEIYGSSIYILFNDKCDRDASKMLLLISATQLGFFSSTELKELADDQCYKINLTPQKWSELSNKVNGQEYKIESGLHNG